MAVFEAGDIYSAGLTHELVPIMAEQYNLDTLEYYVVAVSKEDDPDTDVLYLRGEEYRCALIKCNRVNSNYKGKLSVRWE